MTRSTLTNLDIEYTESLKELNTILKITQEIIGTLDLDRILQIISNGMAELMEIETAAVYLLENETELFLGATTPPLDPHMPVSLRKALLDDHPHIKKTILSRKPQILANTQIAPLSRAEKLVVDLRNLISLVYFPFIQENKVLGVLILGTCNKSRIFSKHDINLGQTIANQLSVAIQNARFHIDLKNHKENLELLVQEKTKDLDAAIEELKTMNEELYLKNEDINQKNNHLESALVHLKETQAHLIQAEKMASLGILTAGVAHEINNPLNFIMGAFEGLKNYFETNGCKEEHEQQINMLLDCLKKGVDNTSKIVQSLNQFSRTNQSFEEDCNIHVIIDNCLLMLNNKLKNRILVHKTFTENNIILKGNSGKLHQVFINILSNAAQAIENDGEIKICTSHNNGEAHIEIIDTGIGIREENLSKITDPFYTTKAPGIGIGLGLYITLQIINEHKGTIKFKSKVNKGTTVLVKLPMH